MGGGRGREGGRSCCLPSGGNDEWENHDTGPKNKPAKGWLSFFSLGHGKEIKLLSKEPNGLDFARNGIILRGPSVGALLLERLYVWIGEGLLGGVGKRIWW